MGLVTLVHSRGAMGQSGPDTSLAAVLAPEIPRSEAAPERHEFTRLLMGVEVRIMVWAESGADSGRAREAASAAFDRIADIEDVASDWRPSSELSRLCSGPIGVDVPVSHDLFTMLACARRVSLASGGAFDVTIGAVTHQWRAARHSGVEPTEEQRRDALSRVGFRNLALDDRGRSARLVMAGIELDLGGIAQGYAAAEALKVMDAAGLGMCVVDLSGDIAIGDAPPGEAGWRVAIPTAIGWQTLTLARRAVSTSGDGEQFVMVEGERESHILTPATGRGVVGVRSVTVIGEDAMLCDAMATAISVMGQSRGIGLAERAAGIDALVVVEDEDNSITESATSGFPLSMSGEDK